MCKLSKKSKHGKSFVFAARTSSCQMELVPATNSRIRVECVSQSCDEFGFFCAYTHAIRIPILFR